MSSNNATGTRKTVEPIDESVNLIRGATWVAGDSNLFFVNEKTGITLFDTGSAHTANLTISALKDFGIPIENVKTIVLTHAHADHSSGILKMKGQNPAIEVWVSHKEVKVLEEADDRIGLWSLIGLEPKPIRVSRQLQEGDTIVTGSFRWEVLETPGHSLGSLCFYERKRKMLISGDTVFARGSVGRVDFPTGNSEELTHSLNRLCELKVNMLLPGHMALETAKGEYWIKKARDFWKTVS